MGVSKWCLCCARAVAGLAWRRMSSLLSDLLLLPLLLVVVRAEHRVSFAPDYNSQLLPPTENGEPVTISASINLRNILGVGEKEQIISLETTLRLYWKVTKWDIISQLSILTLRHHAFNTPH